MGSFPLFGLKWTSFRAEGFSRLCLSLRSLQFLARTINNHNRAAGGPKSASFAMNAIDGETAYVVVAISVTFLLTASLVKMPV